MPQGHNVPCVCVCICVYVNACVFGSRINLKTVRAEMHPGWNIKTQVTPCQRKKITLDSVCVCVCMCVCVCVCVCLICKKMHMCHATERLWKCRGTQRLFLEFLHTGSLTLHIQFTLMYNSTFQLDLHDSFSNESTRTLNFTIKKLLLWCLSKVISVLWSIIAYQEKDLLAFPFTSVAVKGCWKYVIWHPSLLMGPQNLSIKLPWQIGH